MYRMKAASVIISALLVATIFVVVTPEASAVQTWIVDDDGTPGVDCDFTSIQAAIDAASSGDTIEVKNGVYTENIFVDKTLILLGEDPTGTTINSVSSFPVARLLAGGCTLSGFKLDGQSIARYGVWTNSQSNQLIENNIITSCESGMFIYFGWYITATGNTIENCQEYGIRIERSNYCEINSNTMTECGIAIVSDVTYHSVSHWNSHSMDAFNTVNGKPVIYWKGVSGGVVPSGAGQVFLVNCQNVEISGQTVSDTTMGIELIYSTGCTIKDNIALNNYFGLYLFQSSGALIENNIISSNGYFGGGMNIWRSDGITISNNIVSTTEAYDHAIFVWYSLAPVITQNTVTTTYSHAIFVASSGNNMITENIVDAAYGITASSNDNTMNSVVENNIVNVHRDHGIYVVGPDCIVRNNIVTGYSIYAFVITRASNTLVEGNEISGGSQGIRVYDSSNNILKGNMITDCKLGIVLVYSADSNTITENTFFTTSYAIYAHYRADNNLIYHNNIMKGVNDPYPASNYWHHPTLLEGNYWFNYAGADDGSGTGKHADAGDGIGDTDIPHPGPGFDYYPLMNMIPIPPVAIANISSAESSGVKLVNVEEFGVSASYVSCEIWGGNEKLLTLENGDAGQFIYFSDLDYEARYYYEKTGTGNDPANTQLKLRADGGSGIINHKEKFNANPSQQYRDVNINDDLDALQYPSNNRIYVFDGSESYDPDGGPIESWTWNITDTNGNLLDTITGEVVTYTFPAAGEYTIELWVVDDDKQSDTTEIIITV